MAKIQPIDPGRVNTEITSLLREATDLWGMIPNMILTMACSPAVLRGWIHMAGALEQGSLPAGVRASIALLIAEMHQSEYCLRAQRAFARAAGLTEEEIADSRMGVSTDRRNEACLAFVKALVENGGRVREVDLARLRGAGHSDSEIVEVIANVAANIFTSYLNLVAGTEADFPKVPGTIEPRDGARGRGAGAQAGAIAESLSKQEEKKWADKT